MNNILTAVVPAEVRALHKAFCLVARVAWEMNDYRCRMWMEWVRVGKATRPPNGWSVGVLESRLNAAKSRAPGGRWTADEMWWLICRPEDFAALGRPAKARGGLGFAAAPKPTEPEPPVADAAAAFAALRAAVGAPPFRRLSIRSTPPK